MVTRKDMVEKGPRKDIVEREGSSGSNVSNGEIIKVSTTHLINPEAVQATSSGMIHRLSGAEKTGGTNREPTVRAPRRIGTTALTHGKE